MVSTANKVLSKINFLICLLILCLLSCNRQKPLFTKMDASATGVEFSNKLTESDSMNIFTFEYMYNGGGVGVGDFNNDGLQDIFFTGSTVTNKRYLNNGKLQYAKHCTQRGYISNVDSRLFFGLGNSNKIDSLQICWV
jgi:hypothetical protein